MKDKEILVKATKTSSDISNKLSVGFKNMVSLEKFHMKSMKTIIEDTNEQSSSTESNDNFEEVVETQKKNIMETELLNDFKLKQEWFDFKPEIDVKQLEVLEDFYA